MEDTKEPPQEACCEDTQVSPSSLSHPGAASMTPGPPPGTGTIFPAICLFISSESSPKKAETSRKRASSPLKPTCQFQVALALPGAAFFQDVQLPVSLTHASFKSASKEQLDQDVTNQISV